MLVILVVSTHTTRRGCSLELQAVSPFPSLSPTSIHPTARITAMGQTRNSDGKFSTFSGSEEGRVATSWLCFPNAEMYRNDLPQRRLRPIFPRTCGVSPDGKREESNDME